MRDSPSILHVDMDAFYASVEVLADPTLRGRPVIVGGRGARGVVASCTYEARAFGVHSAMPSTRARRLCPHAVFLSGSFETYSEFSRRLHDILTSYTPLVEGISLDEAFVDVAGARRLFGEPETIGWAIRERVHDELGLWCSVGASTTKFIAKLASEAAKPIASPTGAIPGLGVKIVEPGSELAFLHPLPLRALWGVGPATLRRLERFGLKTVGDLAAMPPETLTAAVGEAHGIHLYDLAWARDERAVIPGHQAKSIGHEETFAKDLCEPDDVRTEALRLSDSVATRCRRSGLTGRTITVKIRFGDFRTITRSMTVERPFDNGTDIFRAAIHLLGRVDVSPGVRLLGVSISKLSEREGVQLSLDGAPDDRERAGAAVDEIRLRFGEDAVGPARLVGSGPRRRGERPWGPDDLPT